MSSKPSTKQKKLKIFITGGAGFIGSHLSQKLSLIHEITIYDNLRRNALQFSKNREKKNINFVQGDVLDQVHIEKEMAGHDIVLHLAAIAGVSSYYKNPLQTLEVDAIGTYNILKSAASIGPRQILIFSSSEVYGQKAMNVAETDVTVQGPATDSRWSYAVGKLIGDHFAFAFSKTKNLPITIIRPFNIYGPRQIGEGAISNFVTNALADKPLSIRGEGTYIRSWCYIDDFIDAVISMIDTPAAFNQIFNIGNPATKISVTNLAKLIIQISHSKSKLEYVSSVMTDIIERSPDIAKAEKLINFQPKIKLETGLSKTIEWFREYATISR